MPEVERLHGGCGTLPSSGTVTATESVTALQSPPGVIYCAIQHFSVSVILFLEARIIWVEEKISILIASTVLHFCQSTSSSCAACCMYSAAGKQTQMLAFFSFLPQTLFLSPPCLTSVTAK